MEPGRSLEYQDDELINTIAADVLKVLEQKGFFEALDDQVRPTGNPRLVHATAPTQSQKLSSQNLVSMKKQ